jgi:hypothetical protein
MRISRSYKKGRFGKAWSLSTIGDMDPSARDFGSLIPEIKGYCRDLFPNMHIDPNERIAVMNKETTIRVKDYAPTRDKLPSVLAMGLAWDVTNGVDIDLDASAVCLDKNFNLGKSLSQLSITRLLIIYTHHSLKQSTWFTSKTYALQMALFTILVMRGKEMK